MPGRNDNVGKYRFGFNGKENDNDVKGVGNQQDYGMRIYDTRLGKFLSIDPLTRKYPWYTPYQFAGNKPIQYIDLDGLEEAKPAETVELNDKPVGTTSASDNARYQTPKKDIISKQTQLPSKIPSQRDPGIIKAAKSDYEEFLELNVPDESRSMVRDNPVIKAVAVGGAATLATIVTAESAPIVIKELAGAYLKTVSAAQTAAVAYEASSATTQLGIGIIAGVAQTSLSLNVPPDVTLLSPISEFASALTQQVMEYGDFNKNKPNVKPPKK